MGYNGPSVVPGVPRSSPIATVSSTTDSLGSSYERQQLPLKLAWAITIHKPQGLTLDSVYIDIVNDRQV